MALSVTVTVAVAMSVILLVLPLSPGAIGIAGANGGSVLVATHDVRALLATEPLQTRRLGTKLLRAELLHARRIEPITSALDVIAIGIALTGCSVVVRRVLAILHV